MFQRIIHRFSSMNVLLRQWDTFNINSNNNNSRHVAFCATKRQQPTIKSELFICIGAEHGHSSYIVYTMRVRLNVIHGNHQMGCIGEWHGYYWNFIFRFYELSEWNSYLPFCNLEFFFWLSNVCCSLQIRSNNIFISCDYSTTDNGTAYYTMVATLLWMEFIYCSRTKTKKCMCGIIWSHGNATD